MNVPFTSFEYIHNEIQTEIQTAVMEVIKSNWFIRGNKNEIWRVVCKTGKRVSDYLRALGAEREHLIKILDITLQFLEDEYD